jgi:hypothetical protein
VRRKEGGRRGRAREECWKDKGGRRKDPGVRKKDEGKGGEGIKRK